MSYDLSLLRMWGVREEHVPHLVWLDRPQKARLFRLALAFLKTREWETDGGRHVPLHQRMTVSLNAVLPVLHLGLEVLAPLKRVVIHPSGFDGSDGRYESLRGVVRLAWSAAEAIELHRDDNVILHEVAHALDHRGRITGAGALGHPLAGRLASELALAHVRARRFDDCASLGVSSEERPAEVFAVAVERFFSAPLAFEEASPGLYGGLTELFGLDPADALAGLEQAAADDDTDDTPCAPADPDAAGVASANGTPIAVPGPH